MDPKKTDSPGVLYLVATPIGNLEDITLRALRVLAEVELVAAEDTRHTRKLLSHHGIGTPLVSYRDQNHPAAARRLFALLESGRDVALVSDAGTPGLSDPGQALVRDAVAKRIRVTPVPGPAAAVAALAASGLSTDRFVFIGFPPRKAGAFKRLIEEISTEPGSLVFYESPRRIGKTLGLLAEGLGEREAVVVRELTKIHETFDHGDLASLAEQYADGSRGEVTLVVSGWLGEPAGDGPALIRRAGLGPVLDALVSGERASPGEISGMLAPLCGLSRREIYEMVVRARKEGHQD